MPFNGPTLVKRKRRSSEEIVERLIEAACREFRASGYAGATTAAIAREAEVTEAQLFRCFRSKADLFRASIFTPLDRHFTDFHQRHATMPGDSQALRDAARLYITELQHFIAEHSGMLMSLIVAQTYDSGSMRGVEEMDSLTAYFEHGAAMLPPSCEAARDPKLIVRVSFAAVLASVMFKDWLFPAGMANDQQVGDAIIAFVMDGISANFAAVDSAGAS